MRGAVQNEAGWLVGGLANGEANSSQDELVLGLRCRVMLEHNMPRGMLERERQECWKWPTRGIRSQASRLRRSRSGTARELLPDRPRARYRAPRRRRRA